MSKEKGRSLWQSLFVFLLPLMLSNMLQSVSGTVSSILLGRMIGVNALAAVSGFFPVFFLLISFVIGVGNGSSVLMGQAYGADNHMKIQVIMGTTLSFTLLLGGGLAVIGGLYAPQILRLVGTPENILTDSMLYAQIMFAAMPVIFLYVVYTTFLRSTGDSKTPLYFLIISTVLTLVSTPILIAGGLGLPAMGIQGAALATVLSIMITFLLLIYYLNKKSHPLRFEMSMIHFLWMDWPILKLLIKIGVPSSIQMIFISLSEIALLSLVNSYGSNATAAYGAVNQVISYVEMPAVSLGIAVSVFGSQAIGAGKFERLKAVSRAGFGLNLVISGLLVGVIYLFAGEVLSLFIVDQDTLALANRLLIITLWGYLIFGNLTVLSGLMRSSGTVFWPTVLTIISIWGVLVPSAYLLSNRIGIEGIWVAYPLEFIAALILQYSYYHYIWLNKEHKQLIR